MDIIIGTVALRPYVFAFLACYLMAGIRDLGWRSTLAFGAWLWLVAWLSEFSSTRTGIPFGLYTYTGATRGHELFVADAPFIDALSFTFLAYSAFCLARGALGAAASPGGVTALSGVLMMLLDVVIDPVAVRGDRWFLGPIFYYPNGGVYFGVPLSNFAGWMLVGMIGIGGYIYGRGPARPFGDKPIGGIALYYAVLGFNLAVTAWIGEWVLLAVGCLIHATVAALILMLRRRPLPWADMESQKA